jgi:aspartyl-tRNA(Asn)/glutamyl-tRNA(Gln) amidotransferase subunit B
MIETGRSAADIVEAEGLAQVRDTGAIETWVEEVVAEHPDEMARLRDGEMKILAFLMGQVMRKSGGKADPRVASEMSRERAAGEA